MVDSVRVAKRARFLGNFITVKVGEGKAQKTFGIHEDIIKDTSPFFRAALDKEWKEAQAREVKLPEDSPEIVSCYVDWCYSKEIASTKTHASTAITGEDIFDEYVLLAKLYVFGEKVQDDAFCDTVMAALTELPDQSFVQESGFIWYQCPPCPAISIIYNGTPAGAPIRRFLVDIYVKYGKKGWFEGKDCCYLQVPEFLQELVMAQLKSENVRGSGEKIYDRRYEWFKQQTSLGEGEDAKE